MKLPWRIPPPSGVFAWRVCRLVLSVALVVGILMGIGWSKAHAAPQSGGPYLIIVSFDGNTLTLQFVHGTLGETITLSYSSTGDCNSGRSLPNAAFRVTADPFKWTYIWPSSGIQPGTYYLCVAEPRYSRTFASQQAITVTSTGALQPTPGIPAATRTPTPTRGPADLATQTPLPGTNRNPESTPANAGSSNGFLPDNIRGIPTIAVFLVILGILFFIYMTILLLIRSWRRRDAQHQLLATPPPPLLGARVGAKRRRTDASARVPQLPSRFAKTQYEAAQPARPKSGAPLPETVPVKGPLAPARPSLSPVGTVFCPQCGLQQQIGSGPCPRCGFDLHQALTMVQGMKPQELARPSAPPPSARTPAPAPADEPLPFDVAPDVGKKLPGQEEPPPQQGPLSGQVLGGKYRLEDLLGRGGVGVVYKAYNQLLKRPQAVKVLLEHYVADAKFQERFLREAQTLAALDHANILPVHDFGLEESRAYLVMPFISGGTLHDLLKRRGSPLDVGQVRRALQHIAAALDSAHAQGVVHLDLKPANMLIHPDGRLLLSDFGLAHLLEAGAVEGGTSLQFGTPSYMAPEHIEGQPEPASDIYALGIILYQLLTGQLPFQGSSPLAIIRKQATEPPPPLRRFRPELPVALEGVLGKALAKQPAARYQTAGALLAAFQQVISARQADRE